MADTYEQNLSQKGTLTVSDYIRVVGSDNASYKQLVSDVAKKIIENYTGSSLAGSSQSVKSALDALNSKISWDICTELPLSNCSKYNDIGVQYAVVGNMCHIFVSVSGLTANSRVKIATFPKGARPLINVPYIGVGGTSFTSKAYFTVAGGGELYVLSDDTYANGYMSFIVKA